MYNTRPVTPLPSVARGSRSGNYIIALESLAIFSVGTFVGMLLHTVYKDSEMLGSAERMDRGNGRRSTLGKLAPVSKIAQRVAILISQLSGCCLMELHGC